MRKIDKDGLTLCTLQGNLFVASLENVMTSSEVFIRRFMGSNVAKEFDSLAILDDSLTINGIFQRLEDEFGKSNYGKVKYEPEVLFWVGYLYRYFSYVYALSSKHVYKIIKPKELRELYFVYHTFDPGQAIERILEDKNISFDQDTLNAQLLKLMRKRKYEKGINVFKIETKSPDKLCDSGDNVTSSWTLKDCVFEDEGTGETYYSPVQLNDQAEDLSIAVTYQGEMVGEINFYQDDDPYYELDIVFKKNRNKHQEFLKVALFKAMELVKKEGRMKSLMIKILKTDPLPSDLFKDLGLKYLNEDSDFIYFVQTIN